MTAHDDSRDDASQAPPSAFDLTEEQFEEFQRELARIFGPPAGGEASAERPSKKMMWVLPAPTFVEAMAVLREVASGSGEEGLNRVLAERAPELSEPPDDDWTQDG